MKQPPFPQAVEAIDRGDVAALQALLDAYPALARERLENGESGYFAQPSLLWFVAQNPVRSGTLPPNIVEVTRTILRAGAGREQLDYAAGLVASGRVPRECGVQRELIDVLVDAGADPNPAILPAAAHRERDAVAHLLARGATLTLVAAIATQRRDDSARLAAAASIDERQLALVAAALYGDAATLRLLLDRRDLDVSAYAPDGFHPHGTALHHAVDSGALDAVRLLVEAGADVTLRDRIYDGTPLDWAEYLERPEIAAYLRAR